MRAPPTPSLRPLVVAHTGADCGSNAIVLGLLRHRPEHVRPLCAFLGDGPVPAQARALGVETHVLDAGRARDARRAGAAVLALARLAHRGRADVVFAHTSKAQVYAGTAALLTGVPSVWYEHEVPGSGKGAPGRQRALQRLASRIPARAVLCPSDYVAAAHRAQRPRARVERRPPGAPVANAVVRRHQDGAEVRLAIAGRLQRWKRVELALDALALALADAPGLRLRIAGDARPDLDADYPAELRARAARLGVGHAVAFVGDVPLVEDALADTDVLLHLADGDSFGLMVVEALARGVPVIVAPGGGPAEVVRDGVDGLVIEPTDAPALARGILRLARDPGLRTALGAAGRSRALACFDERVTATETWDRVAALAASPGGAPRRRRAVAGGASA